jgi:beta-glucosidase
VINSGDRRGTEVVQLYASDTATGVTLPAQQLIGFTRLDLEPGASKTVTFVVPISLLAYTGVSGQLIMEPGPAGRNAPSWVAAFRSRSFGNAPSRGFQASIGVTSTGRGTTL